MKKIQLHARLLAVAATIPLALVFSGCSVVDELAHKTRSASFDTAAELTAEWEGDAAWLPADATDIEIRESTTDTVAVILASSGDELDPALCTLVPRQSAPAYELEGSASAYDVDEVFACGEWAVMASETGWFGWNPNHPGEAQQSPTS